MKTAARNTANPRGAQDCDKSGSDETETRLLLPIRVLYTINASPQFLLARQRRKVQVVPIAWRAESTAKAFVPGPADSTSGCHRFAKVPLKACLGAVCTSSPELLADRSRDYSVYVLDPLESTSAEGTHAASKLESLPIDSRTSDTTASSSMLREGVSIGMGLMSWCIADDRVAVPEVGDDDNDGCVIGKLVMDRGSDALEVVIFLRETSVQSQQQHAFSLSSLGFCPSSTASRTGYSSLGNGQYPLSVPSSPRSTVLSSLPESSQSSIGSVDHYGRCVPECVEASMPDAASSSTSRHTSKIGRPPGSATNPEKRARRLAIQSHKEMLERMENIAKMQQGREYDKTLIRVSDHDIPTVTDEELARQRKILQELEAKPLILDQSRFLTTKPLSKRARASTSIVPLSKNTISKRSSRSTSTTNTVETKHGTQLLLSLLTSVLGKVDGPPATQPNSITSQKGKEKVSADDALAGVLKELLPFIPNAVQASAVSASRANPSPASTIPTSVAPPDDQRSNFRPQRSLFPNLFKTAAETFHDSYSGSDGSYHQQRASAQEQPKVREDAYPVPGGGWARGRNLIPRTTITSHVSLPSNGQIECPAGDPTKGTSAPTVQTEPDKENTPPMKAGRGLKRALSTMGEAGETGGVSHKANDKKRKQNSAPTVGSNEPGDKRPATGLTARDKTNTSGASGLLAAASSPPRSTASARATHSLPVMAMSEPDYPTPPPIVAISPCPELIKEPPRTPPRRETSLDENAGDSLFTPCAPDDESPPLFRGGTHHLDNGPPCSPSAARRKSHTGHVTDYLPVPGGSQESSGTESESRLVKTGWDLPPSSPPPPTSPISPYAEIGSEQDGNMDLVSTLSLKNGVVEMEKGSTDGKYGNQCTTIKSDGVSTPVAETFQMADYSSDFDLLTDADFGFGLQRQVQEGTEGIELDVEELWGSLGPVIAHAQSDSNIPEMSSQVEADFSYFDLGDDQNHLETEGVQSGVDATKLAEDLKALFGGCVV